MTDEGSSLFAEERRVKIFELLQKEKRVLAKELAEMFQISIDSIRRDFTIMEEQGLLKKTHGGAIPAPQARQAPRASEERYGDGTPAQNAVAKQAASYVRENDTLFIGSGSTHYVLLKHLPERMPLTIVTNCMRAADALREKEWIDTYFIGGRVKRSGNVTDALANEFVRQFNIDIFFVTGGGISERGVSTATPEVAAFGRAVSSVSKRKIGLATYNIIGSDSFAKAMPIDELDLLITDDESDPEAVERIRSAGVHVITTSH